MTRDATRTVLLTGFGPFPGVPQNATGRLVPRLAERARRRFAGISFTTAILPTEWDRGPRQLARHLGRGPFAVALHFGVSQQARGFVIETRGRNACRPSPDAAGRSPPRPRIDAEGPTERPVNLPVARIVERLAALELPVATSDDAGGYLCNAVLYHSLALAETGTGAALTGFVHVPVDLAAPGASLTLDQAIHGGLEIIAACLDAAATAANRTT